MYYNNRKVERHITRDKMCSIINKKNVMYKYERWRFLSGAAARTKFSGKKKSSKGVHVKIGLYKKQIQIMKMRIKIKKKIREVQE